MRKATQGPPGGPAELAPGTVTPSSPAVSRRRTTVAVALFAAALAALVYWLAHAALSDDSYITLDYARNLAMHGHWGLTGKLTSNSATSPLDVLALGLLMFCSRLLSGGPAPLVCLGVFTAATMTATSLWSLRIARDLRLPAWTAVLAAGLVIAQPLALSSVGLETSLLVCLLFGLVSEAVRGRPLRFGALAGLALLARLDMVIFVLVIGLATAAIRRRWWRVLLSLVPVALPWFLFSWLWLGSAIPVTLAIKQYQNYPGDWTFASGLELFLTGDTRATLVSVLPAAAGVIALGYWGVVRLRARRAPGQPGTTWSPVLAVPAAFAVAGLVYFGAYAALGVPPYVWYYAPTLVALTTFFACATGAGLRDHRPALRPVVAGPAACLFLACVGVDLAHGLPWRAPPIFGNVAMPADYARVGRQLGHIVGDAAVQSPGELGTLVYYCHCEIVDQFSDPGRALPFVRKQLTDAGGVREWLLRLNYTHLRTDIHPVPVQYRLVWYPGWVAERQGVWNVYSPAPGRGHFTLLPQ